MVMAETRKDWCLRKTSELKVWTAIVTMKYAFAQLPVWLRMAFQDLRFDTSGY